MLEIGKNKKMELHWIMGMLMCVEFFFLVILPFEFEKCKKTQNDKVLMVGFTFKYT